jgi:nitroreductase
MKSDIVSPEVIKAAFTFRHAAKRFDPDKKISDSEFAFILEAARLSPSSFGFEPWNIIVADPTLRRELVPFCWGAQGHLPTASQFIIFTAKTSAAMRPDALYPKQVLMKVRGMSEAEADDYISFYEKWLRDDFDRLDAPQLLHEWAARQAYIAAGNMMTVAAMRGVDSCAIEGFTVREVTKLLADRKYIDPRQDAPVLMLAFGYRIDPPKAKTRRPLSEIIKGDLDNEE